MKKWRLEKTIRENGQTELSLRDLEHGFLADTSINKWMILDIIETCGGIENIQFQDPEHEKQISLLIEKNLI